MKNKFIGFFVLMFVLIAPTFVYADQISSNKVEFAVTSGIELGNTESTFDKTRTITGSSESGSLISITLSKKNASGVLNNYASYQIEVGPVGLFSQTVELEIGENVVSVVAEKEGKKSSSGQCVIKRKNRQIKKELETGVSIPGISSKVSRY
ncbi:MAG: hypothetical protein IAC55_02480 [Tyzzerella sp.]|uniref:Uncharacterized protein n=1 Tax=Candidatus Fimicola merdigallinarum TaxID=2840819 RepID=A0A9D9DU44_9FIRM|nr:hypothetical protein [Candidatus Fimicola merdigallinarum]